MRNRGYFALLHSEFLDPLISIKVVHNELPEELVKIVHSTINDHKAAQDPCDMVSSAEALQLVLLPLLPEPCIDVIGVEIFQSEGLSDARQGRLASIGNEQILVLHQRVVVNARWTLVTCLGKLVLHRVIDLEFCDSFDATTSMNVDVLIIRRE
jgi:hypothetical protein